MPGINTTGLPNTNDYNLGRGKVYFATLDANNKPTAYRDLGNAPEFSISIETETLEHQSSRQGLKVTDKEVLVSQKVSLSLTLDEINFDNLAALLSGETDTYTNSLGSTAVTDILITPAVADGGLVQGRWYDIIDSSGNRVYDIAEAADVSVEDSSAGAASLTTDYLLDLKMGRIFVVTGSTVLTAGEEMNVTVATDAAVADTVDEVKALTQTSVLGALKFVAENPAANDQQTEYQFHKVSLKAEGDFALIGDEFSTMSFTAVAESNEDADADSPTLTIRTVVA